MVNYPIFLNLKDKDILIIGGGLASREKLPKLMKSQAKITIITREINPQTLDMIKDYKFISLIVRPIELGDLDNRFMIFCATDNHKKNKELVQYARKKNILINSVDNPKNCDFFSMALLEKGNVSLGFSTHGKYAGFAVLLRDIFDELIPEKDIPLIEELFKLRTHLKKHLPEEKKRREALLSLLEELKEKYFK